MTIASRPAIFIVRIYQWCVSPFLGAACRFHPTCSHYAAEALERHGLIKGLWLTAKRLSRCHPFGATGYDPVPTTHQE